MGMKLSSRNNKSPHTTFTKDPPSEGKKRRQKYVKEEGKKQQQRLAERMEERRRQIYAEKKEKALPQEYIDEKEEKRQQEYDNKKGEIDATKRLISKDILKRASKINNNGVPDSYPDYSIILKNVIKLISQTQFYGDEVTEIRIKNVIKPDYNKIKILINGNINTDWIVDEITPIEMDYPTCCEPLPIRLSIGAKDVIRDEIEFLRNIDKQYLRSFTVKTLLFPLKFGSNHLYIKPEARLPNQDRGMINVPEVPMKPKISSQQKKMARLKGQLKGMNGISQYCTELISDGMSRDYVIQLLQRFTIYLGEKYIKEIIAMLPTV